MDTATRNSGRAHTFKPDTTKKVQSHHREHFSLDFAATPSWQHLLYILNTSALIVIAFIAGYNLKNREMQQEVNSVLKSAEQYILKAKANYSQSERLLADLKNAGTTHFESAVTTVPETFRADAAEITAPVGSSPTKTPLPPSQSEPQRAVKQATAIDFPQNQAPGIYIDHTIKKGESLSELLGKNAIADFLKSNPQITNPDLIYPGQTIRIRIPEQSITTGSHLNNYFIRPITPPNGKQTYMLVKSFEISESETLLSHIVNQNEPVIVKSTIPYINLSDFTNTMKEEIWDGNAVIRTRKTKISTVGISQTGIHFKTLSSNPIFNVNDYTGIWSARNHDYYKQLDTIKGFLIKYLASRQPEKRLDTLFHFMIFGETIVQTDFIDAEAFNDTSEKASIVIALVHSNSQTKNALFKLQRALSTCKINEGEIIELSQDNFRRYQRHFF